PAVYQIDGGFRAALAARAARFDPSPGSATDSIGKADRSVGRTADHDGGAHQPAGTAADHRSRTYRRAGTAGAAGPGAGVRLRRRTLGRPGANRQEGLAAEAPPDAGGRNFRRL